ncbi:MAG TPA: GNAT family N-acetyltransferase [Holophaga sp.]|nr:GNAT family N-acetyltransferase [Holophaga sp.]
MPDLDIRIRPLEPADSLEALTELIHAAYAVHAAQGLRYWATHQSCEDTRRRFASGTGFIAEAGVGYVGTITLRAPNPDSPVPLYRDPGVWTLGQFAVAPPFKGQGVGRLLHDAAVAHAVRNGARIMAFDTAEPAMALIRKYEGWGYRIVDHCDWRPHTNYPSVVMSRLLAGGEQAP